MTKKSSTPSVQSKEKQECPVLPNGFNDEERASFERVFHWLNRTSIEKYDPAQCLADLKQATSFQEGKRLVWKKYLSSTFRDQNMPKGKCGSEVLEAHWRATQSRVDVALKKQQISQRELFFKIKASHPEGADAIERQMSDMLVVLNELRLLNVDSLSNTLMEAVVHGKTKSAQNFMDFFFYTLGGSWKTKMSIENSKRRRSSQLSLRRMVEVEDSGLEGEESFVRVPLATYFVSQCRSVKEIVPMLQMAEEKWGLLQANPMSLWVGWAITVEREEGISGLVGIQKARKTSKQDELFQHLLPTLTWTLWQKLAASKKRKGSEQLWWQELDALVQQKCLIKDSDVSSQPMSRKRKTL
jgi:hypothetical protein